MYTKLHSSESAQTLVEYSLIMGLIVIAAVVALTLFSGVLDGLLGLPAENGRIRRLAVQPLQPAGGCRRSHVDSGLRERGLAVLSAVRRRGGVQALRVALSSSGRRRSPLGDPPVGRDREAVGDRPDRS